MADESEGDGELLQRLMLLKNGSHHPALPAYVVWHSLNRVHAYHRNDLAALNSTAHSPTCSIPDGYESRLRNEYRNWFDRNGVLSELTKDVIQSSIRDTAEGLVVVDPFQIRSDLDRTAIELVQQHDQLFLRRLFRRDDPTSGPPMD